jgi:hypothetical protein
LEKRGRTACCACERIKLLWNPRVGDLAQETETKQIRRRERVMGPIKGDIPPASIFVPQSAGVWGDSHGGRGVVGTSDRRAGVTGISDIRPGVIGTSARDRGVYGSGRAVGVHGHCDTPASDVDPLVLYPGVFGEAVDCGVLAVGGLGLQCQTTIRPGGQAAQFEGYVFIKGTLYADELVVTNPANKHASVPHPDGTHRALCSLECPEAWFEDFGRAELRRSNGSANRSRLCRCHRNG